MSENLTIWKSNNQGVQEETFWFLLGGGAETGSQGGEEMQQGGSWWTRWVRQRLADRTAPHSLRINREEHLESTRLPWVPAQAK